MQTSREVICGQTRALKLRNQNPFKPKTELRCVSYKLVAYVCRLVGVALRGLEQNTK